MANLLSSLYIEAQADLCDCQYSSSSGLCYASEPAKWKQLQSHTHTHTHGGCGVVVLVVVVVVVVVGGVVAWKAAIGSVIAFAFACTDTRNRLAILVSKQQLTLKPLVRHLLCLLSFRFALSVTGSVRQTVAEQNCCSCVSKWAGFFSRQVPASTGLLVFWFWVATQNLIASLDFLV